MAGNNVLYAESLEMDGVLNGHDRSIFFRIFILPSYSANELLEPNGELRNI